jgi:DNA-binding CsgD family transcriptional regulator
MADGWLPPEQALDLAVSAVEALEGFDPLGNLTLASQIVDLRRAQAAEPAAGRTTPDHPVEVAVAEIDRLMNRRADAWFAWSAGDDTAGKRLVELGREAMAVGHRFWGLASFLDAIRLGLGQDVVADVDHLAITRGAGLAVLASRAARATTAEDHHLMAKEWWMAGATTYAIESAIRAAETGSPLDAAAVQLLHTQGARPLVLEYPQPSGPLSDRQLTIVTSTLVGASNEETAEKLFLSRRTVENHLHRVYRELSIGGGRDELIDRLGWIAAD